MREVGGMGVKGMEERWKGGKVRQNEGNVTWAWYFKSFLVFPVVKFHTSINPSALPVTRY